MSRTSDLYDLQYVDSELDQHNNRLDEIDDLLGNDKELKSSEKEVQTQNTVLEIAVSNLTSAENKVKEQRLKIIRTEGNLYGGKISNPKELQDIQGEVQALKRFLVVLEDRQLEFMVLVDEKREIFRSAQEKLSAVKNEFNNLHTELFAEKRQIEGMIDELKNRRESVLTNISADDIQIYESIRKQRYGVAVSKVQNQACSACGATLTAALNQAARTPNQLTYCETCGRILVS